jgi:hypothetical protein
MSLRHARILAITGGLLLALAAAAQAAVLWDQSAIDFSPTAPGIADGRFTGLGGYTDYSVNDVTVPASGWVVTTITEYFSDWQGVNMNTKAPTGSLIVVPKSGSLPSGTPGTTTVSLTWVDTSQSGQGVYVMTAANLNLSLAPGDYWITVAPTAPVDNFNGNNLQWPSLLQGSAVATFNGTSWSNLYGSRDGAFRIDGTLGPTATHNGTWGAIKSLYR